MSANVNYENKYDDEVEECVRKPLEAIIHLPKEERSTAFWKAVGNKAEQDDLVLLLSKAHDKRFSKLLQNGYEEYKAVQNRFDLDVWYESLKVTIEEFKFDDVKFIIKLRNNYTLIYNKIKRAEELDKVTGGLGYSREKQSGHNRKNELAKYLKLYECVLERLKMTGQEGTEEELQQLTREKILGIDTRCTNNILDEVEKLRKGKLLENYRDTEDEEISLLDKESYKESDTFFGINPENLLVFEEMKVEKGSQIDKLIEKIKIEFEYLNVEIRECFRAFLTRDILAYLKLEANGLDYQGDEEKYYKLCEGKHRYTERPAGNFALYEELTEREEFFMQNLFHENYIQFAVEDDPESLLTLYGIYYNLLRKEFKFTDIGVANMVGLTKQTLPRWYKRYENFKKEKYKI